MQDLEYWIWLSKLNISARARSVILKEFESAKDAFLSKPGSFRKRRGISAQEAELLEQRNLSGVEETCERCEEQGLRVLPYTASGFPECLRHIYSPPAVLFVKGMLPDLDERPVISVIGTRKASPYGVKMGDLLAFDISRRGGTIVSLLSSGVDEAAAHGALRSGKTCIGVLGTPHENSRFTIGDSVLQNGALISEYPPGRECSRYFFRERNRIAAGISDGVVVVEAPEKSGTRLFVSEAIEQGKDIFAVPGNADAENAAGTLRLLKEGAKLVTCGREVLEEYEGRYPGMICLDIEPENETQVNTEAEAVPPTAATKAEVQKKAVSETPKRDIREQLAQLTEDQLKIVSAIDTSTTHIDDITERTGLSTARVLAQLTVLEIKGYVRREAGRRFALNIKTEK